MTREELEERAEDCQMADDYIGVVTDIIKHIDDKEWAMEVFEEGAEWAADAQELLQYAATAATVLKDTEKAQEIVEQAKGMCQTSADLQGLADVVLSTGDEEAAGQAYLQAADKCKSPMELLELGKHVGEKLSDGDLSTRINAKATEKCKNADDFAELAGLLMEKFNDKQWAEKVLNQGVEICTTGKDYSTLALGALTKLNDQDLARSLFQNAEKKITTGTELTALAVSCANDLKDTDYARELFTNALKLCEKCEESVKVAEAFLDTIGEEKTGIHYYQQAEQRCSGHSNYLKLAESVLHKTSDKALAARYFRKAGEAAERAAQMVNVAEKLAGEINNTEEALSLLRSAEKKASNPKTFIEVAETILKYTQDKNWKEEINQQLEKREKHGKTYDVFMTAEQECDTPACYRNLATKVFTTTGDVPYCRRLYEKAEATSVFFDEFFHLAQGISAHVGDQQWLQRTYENILTKWNDLADINIIAEKMVDQLETGRDFVVKLYQQEEEKCSTAMGFIKIGASVARALKDFAWVRNLLERSEKRATSRHEILELAKAVQVYLDDTEWAASLAAQSARQSTNHFAFRGVVNSLQESSLATRDVLRNIHEEAQHNFTNAADLKTLAESIALNVGDDQWARSVYTLAKEANNGEIDPHRLAESAIRTLNDPKFANTLRTAG
ncbi:MAG: tetratricopeptide repeat protein [Desulfopila sp.]